MTAISAAGATDSHETANPSPDLPEIRGPHVGPQPARPCDPITSRLPSPRFGDDLWTRFESRVAFGGPDDNEGEDAEGGEIATPTRRFSLLEITSGLPDDSWEADEKQEERRLHDLRARRKMAWSVVSTTPGLAETVAADWQPAARFYARFV